MIRDDSGKLLLEAAMLMPVITLITVGSLLLAFGTAIDAAVFVQSDAASSRIAYTWDNSHRNPLTGAFHPGMYDDLYWRLTSDYGGSALADKKLSAGLSAAYGAIADKRGQYANHVWRRQVKATFRSLLSMPGAIWAIFGDRPAGHTAASLVVDPVEWVRTVDTVRLYWPIIRNAVTGEQAEQMVDEFRRRPGASSGPVSFDSHDEARAYLQQLVNGHQSREQTEEVGQWRMIDARDRYNVAHQVYYGAKTLNADTRFQLSKDAELLRGGKVSGVTWHFFRRSRDQSVGLSDALRKELEQRGIVIVIHE